MAVMMLIVTNPRAMGHLTLGPKGRVLGWTATAIMAAATALFFASLL
jgi:Mn2+/Fe2+ NRAMP family transporter